MSDYNLKQEVSDQYSLRGRVFNKLREDILSGELKENEELRESAIGEALGVSRTPVREAFRQQSDALQLYFKTDHHWTLEGAYIAYCEYCESADIQRHSYGSFVPEKVSKRFKGTLYSKALDKDAEYDDIYAVPAGNFSNVMPVCDGRKMKGIYDVSKLDEKDKYAYFKTISFD